MSITHSGATSVVINTEADAELVAAVTGQKIRVIGYGFTVGGAQTVHFESATTDISGIMEFASQGQGISYAGNPDSFAFETAAGEALNIDVSAAEGVDGHLTYVYVAP